MTWSQTLWLLEHWQVWPGHPAVPRLGGFRLSHGWWFLLPVVGVYAPLWTRGNVSHFYVTIVKLHFWWSQTVKVSLLLIVFDVHLSTSRVIKIQQLPDPEKNNSTTALSTASKITSKTKVSSISELSSKLDISDVSDISSRSERTSDSGRSARSGRSSKTGRTTSYAGSSSGSESNASTVSTSQSGSRTVSSLSGSSKTESMPFIKNSYIWVSLSDGSVRLTLSCDQSFWVMELVCMCNSVTVMTF